MSEIQKLSIAEKLKHYRRINCLSQEKLAETSGISIRTIQRIEEGKSSGSGYTVTALAKALQINADDLVDSVSQSELSAATGTAQLKILNLSALAMFFIPFANIVFPLYCYWRNRADEKVKTTGGKIISFQIFWTLGTLLISLLLPALLLLLFPTLRTGGIPLFIPVYFMAAVCNSFFVIRFAISINKQEPVGDYIPNLL